MPISFSLWIIMSPNKITKLFATFAAFIPSWDPAFLPEARSTTISISLLCVNGFCLVMIFRFHLLRWGLNSNWLLSCTCCLKFVKRHHHHLIKIDFGLFHHYDSTLTSNWTTLLTKTVLSSTKPSTLQTWKHFGLRCSASCRPFVFKKSRCSRR